MNLSKTERTRQHIISTTAPIFNKKGYVGTSISDLTKATKLTSGSIYGNFGNKEEVAVAAFDYNLAKLRNMIQTAVDSCSTTREKILMYVKVYHSKQVGLSGGGCPMQNTLTDADDTLEELRQHAADGLMRWKKDLVSILNKGFKEGIVKTGTDTEKAALQIMALIEFGFLMMSATRSRKKMDEMVQIAVEFTEKLLA
jgi:TetR/AcrR family transcriptional repressor of nem operon